MLLFIYYESRTKVHEKKHTQENTDHRKHKKEIQKNTSRKTHHIVHI